MNIKPSTEIIEKWIEIYVPTKDLFFLTEEQLNSKIDYSDVLVIPIEEFNEHSTYGQISYTNSYEYWNIKRAKYVIVAESDWIERISAKQKQLILSAQVECERGLVLPVSFIQNIKDIPADYVQNDHVVLQRAMWEKLNSTTKEQLLSKMVLEWWDNGECEEIPSILPAYLKPYANTFGTVQGANCLAAVLFAITEGKQLWFIKEWVHQKTFLEKLTQYNYQIVDTESLNPRDVAVWQDENGIIQHAAFYIGQNVFFNKHGQTIFNPWKLLSKRELEKEWGNLKQVLYRQLDL